MSWTMRLIFSGAKIYWRIFQPLTLGVKVMLIQDEHILLVQHSYDRRWFLPGGGVKKGETLETAVRREAREELGAAMQQLTLLGTYSHNEYHKNDHIILFLCQEFSWQPDKKNREILAARFFPLHQLPAKTTPGTCRRIQRFLQNGPWPEYGPW